MIILHLDALNYNSGVDWFKVQNFRVHRCFVLFFYRLMFQTVQIRCVELSEKKTVAYAIQTYDVAENPNALFRCRIESMTKI